MPEGDTLHRIAAGLRPFLVGRIVTAASASRPGPRCELMVGARIEAVDSNGKNLLVRFGRGLELRTHLGMRGSWHRHAPGQPWRRSPSRARLVIEVPGAVAVCFDAPVVELFETRIEPIHPVLGSLGPDLLAPRFGEAEVAETIRRWRTRPSGTTVGEALLDQRAAAGMGNVYRSEVLFVERVGPFLPLGSIDDATLRRLAATGRRLLLANLDRAERATTDVASALDEAPQRPSRRPGLWVYGRSGRPCRRCGTAIRSRRYGANARTVYWCPACQPAGAEVSPWGG